MSRAIVWLGLEKEASNNAIATIRPLSSHLLYDRAICMLVSDKTTPLRTDEETWTSLSLLTIRPWLGRRLIWQELLCQLRYDPPM
jgi:hypothetical protein